MPTWPDRRPGHGEGPATVSHDTEVAPGVRLPFIDIGPASELNVF
ncbi:MAG: hypothetical protein ACRDTH_03645 [Pseudonocardiaceae bacterium]